ncbi:MAG: hypothetical protein ACOC22_00205 [bacterium]
MEEKKNLASLSKGTKTTGKTTKKPVVKKRATKTSTEKNNDKVISNRELKAKETVSKLLDEVPLRKKEEVQPQTSEIKRGTEWLEEQLQILTEKNEKLEKDAVEAKENYKKIFDDFQKLKQSKAGESNPEKEKVIQLFNELQDNYGKLGQNFRVYFPAFLNRMVMFFPFLKTYKKF